MINPGAARHDVICISSILFFCSLLVACSEDVQRARSDGSYDLARASDSGVAGDGPMAEAGPSDGAADGPRDGAAGTHDARPLHDSARPPDKAKPLDGAPAPKIWAKAYYAGWMQSTLPPNKIDYAALSQIIHFALVVNADGTVDDQTNGVTAANAAAAVQAAHGAGKQILISVGGGGSDAGFLGATSAANRAAFIQNLVNLVSSRGYDGIDLDWEPMSSSPTQLAALVSGLRTALDQKKKGLLLTAAVGASEASLVAPIAAQLDQINVMTYDLSGAWPGWVTWHNSPVYTGGCKFQSTGQPVPCTDSSIQAFIAAGVPAKKLGIGVVFYGYVWSGGSGTTTGGVTQPCQTYATDPTVSGISYAQIMSTYYQASYAHWDSGAQAAYLSVDQSGSASDKFITYDNEQSVAMKVQYAKSKGLGGVFIWELGGGYRPTMPAGQQDVLLQALKSAVSP